MGSLRKTVSSNLGEETDKDLIDYVSKMEKKGINNSRLIKQALRFYRDYGNKIKQLDAVDIANILDNDEVKEHIGNMVQKVLKESVSNNVQVPSNIQVQQEEIVATTEETGVRELNIDEAEYLKMLGSVKDKSKN